MSEQDKKQAHEKICLSARQQEDMPVLSACLQDAILRPGDSSWCPDDHVFGLLVNRFCWEDAACDRQARRVFSSLLFRRVLGVKSRGLACKQGGFLHLLALDFSQDSSQDFSQNFSKGASKAGGVLDLHFSGGGQIRLLLEALEAELRDTDTSWPAQHIPDHRD